MKYRSEIDGLRALAVIPVILFHAGFDMFDGGFVGVDIFFVISGYLITSIIHDEIRNDSFSIISFYERRIRRILPALFFVSLACIPFAWLWLFPVQYKDFSQDLVAVNLFSSNILFWLQSGYFAPASELKPLLHTWSLAVEEQFYVFFPLVLLLFRKFRDNSLLILLIIIALLSLGLSEYGARYYPKANFYLLPSRAWELGVGSILAISTPYLKQVKRSTAQVISFVGIGMVIYSIFFFDEAVPFPSSIGLIPVVGTALIIAYAKRETIVGKILGWRPIVGIGLISYSAYLWHQPLFAFARIRMLDRPTPEIYIALSFCALLLAYFTWRFIEAPFRNKDKFNRVQILSGALIISIIYIGFGLFGFFTSGIPGRLNNNIINYSESSTDLPTRRKICFPWTNTFPLPPREECIYNTDFELKTAIWGDSQAEAIKDKLALNLSMEKTGLIQLTYSTCPPAIGFKVSHKTMECNKFNKKALEYLKNSNIETVILLARWTLYIEGERFNNMEGGLEPGVDVYGLPIAENNNFIDSKRRVPEIGKLYRSTIEVLLNAGKKVILVYPVPEVGWNVPIYGSKLLLHYPQKSEALSTSFDVFKMRSQNTYLQLDALNEHPNLLRVYPEKIFCNTVTTGRCIAELEKKPLYYDDNHLNSIGSDILTKEIIKHMKIKGWIK